MAIAGHMVAATVWVPRWGDQWWQIAPGTPPVLGTGEELTLRIYWRNESTVSVRGSMAMAVVRPDGSKFFPAVVSGQNAVKGPQVIGMFEFAPFVLDQPGLWSAKGELSGEAA